METRVSRPRRQWESAPVAAEDHVVLVDAGFDQRAGETPGRYRRVEGEDYMYITRYVYTSGQVTWSAYRYYRNASWHGEALPTAAAALAFAEVENWGRK